MSKTPCTVEAEAAAAAALRVSRLFNGDDLEAIAGNFDAANRERRSKASVEV